MTGDETEQRYKKPERIRYNVCIINYLQRRPGQGRGCEDLNQVLANGPIFVWATLRKLNPDRKR